MRAARLLAPSVLGLALWSSGCDRAQHAARDLDLGVADLATADTALASCMPSAAPVCDGSAVKTCRSDGSGYDYEPCTMGCANGSCRQNGCASDSSSSNPHALPESAWPRFRHDNRNTGATSAVVPDLPTQQLKLWVGHNSDTKNNFFSAPVVNQDNVVYAVGGDFNANNGLPVLSAFDGSGKSVYTFPLMATVRSTPTVRLDGTVYLSSENNTLYAVSPAGKEQWHFQTNSNADASPIITYDGIVIYGSYDGSLYALDGNGVLQWKSDPKKGPGAVDGALAESCDGRILAGGDNGWVALDAADGHTLWAYPPVSASGSDGIAFSSPLVTEDGTMYGFDANARGVRIDPSGVMLWRVQVAQPYYHIGSSTALVGDTLLTVLDDMGAVKLFAVDAKNGNVQWSVPVPVALPNNAPVVDGKQRLYLNCDDGYVYSFDTTGKQRWRLAASGMTADASGVASPAIGGDGTLYVPGNDGYLYVYR
jgi:outer membrane protein assembly factor BamB